MPNVMAAQSNIGGALCESSVIPFLVPRRKVWLTPAAGVPCSSLTLPIYENARLGSEFCTWQNSVRGNSPENVYIVYQPRRQHCAKFGWPPVSDVAAVTKARRETG